MLKFQTFLPTVTKEGLLCDLIKHRKLIVTIFKTITYGLL